MTKSKGVTLQQSNFSQLVSPLEEISDIDESDEIKRDVRETSKLRSMFDAGQSLSSGSI
jgi:hypothetical protein